MRPLIAEPSCSTHTLSNLLDILLRPYTNHAKSDLHDIMHYLTRLHENAPSFFRWPVTLLKVRATKAPTGFKQSFFGKLSISKYEVYVKRYYFSLQWKILRTDKRHCNGDRVCLRIRYFDHRLLRGNKLYLKTRNTFRKILRHILKSTKIDFWRIVLCFGTNLQMTCIIFIDFWNIYLKYQIYYGTQQD